MYNNKGKKGKRKKKYLNNGLSDVTINDFANSSDGKGKPRKSHISNVLREVKHLTIQEDKRAWDEKLEDFEGDLEFIEDEQKEVHVVKKEQGRKKTESKNEDDVNRNGAMFPIEIWFLISEHIRPEDISSFARICKATLGVVNMSSFWLNLYKRYYKPIPYLPERLKPDCIVRRYSLKATIIRSLFYMYPPFISIVKRKSRTPLDVTDPLIRRQCICIWQEVCKITDKYSYNFKLMRKNMSNQSNSKKMGMLETLDDINANPDIECKILQVLSSVYIPLEPTLMGQILHSVDLNKDLKCLSIQMVFGSGIINNGKFQKIDTTSVLIRSVVKVTVLDWWHPNYPYNSRIIYSKSEY
uniref:F-box domain-containing protein n=1 Tax=Clastoptera arizonana TaxID=38151 RepID=A0A1B6C2Q9_9HEMI